MGYEILQRSTVIATTDTERAAEDIAFALQHEYPYIPFTYRRSS